MLGSPESSGYPTLGECQINGNGLSQRWIFDSRRYTACIATEVRVPPLASAKTVLRWYPRGNCILAQPDRDVAAAPEATLVLPPVPDSVLLLVLAVDSARLRCDHDVTPPDLYDGLDPTPAASVLAYTDSCTNACLLANWLPRREDHGQVSIIMSVLLDVS